MFPYDLIWHILTLPYLMWYYVTLCCLTLPLSLLLWQPCATIYIVFCCRLYVFLRFEYLISNWYFWVVFRRIVWIHWCHCVPVNCFSSQLQFLLSCVTLSIILHIVLSNEAVDKEKSRDYGQIMIQFRLKSTLLVSGSVVFAISSTNFHCLFCCYFSSKMLPVTWTA